MTVVMLFVVVMLLAFAAWMQVLINRDPMKHVRKGWYRR